jgi:beta-barrel assembly-enhancing protease
VARLLEFILMRLARLISAVVLACYICSPNLIYAGIREPILDSLFIENLSMEEQRVWSASNDFEKAIRKGGQIYDSPELQIYLQGIMNKLYPELGGNIIVHVINSPVLNAFALPNGHVYLNTGLLARFDNEAQLATVLAHEGAHFVYRHGYYNQQSLKSASAFATITAVLGVPIIGLMGNVIAVSSIFGYSRELETEADNVGFHRLASAGYDVTEAAKVFDHLAAEVKLSEMQESVFYSTHPKLKDRVENFSKLAETYLPSGERQEAGYAAKVDRLRIESLESELSFGRYKHVVALLSDERVHHRYPMTLHYYLGEAYRRRGEKDDAEKAIKELNKAIELVPTYAPTYRSKGMLLMNQNKNDDAIKEFRHYLELAPDAKDKSYISDYIESLSKQKTQI